MGIESYEDFIQTDSSINPGNSGGALINLSGELVRINTAIISKTGGNMGIGFAIPIDMAKGIMSQLIEHGEIKRGQIGVHIQDVSPEIAKALDLESNQSGALISNVVSNSPAADAGIKSGDIVISINGEKVSGAADLRNKIGLISTGDKGKLEIIRDGDTKTFEVQIKESEFFAAKNGGETTDIKFLKGAEFAQNFGDVGGVKVINVEDGSPTARAGLAEGDIIFSVKKQMVKTPKELFTAAEKTKRGILLNIKRGNAILYIVIN